MMRHRRALRGHAKKLPEPLIVLAAAGLGLLTLDATSLNGLSERLITSHHANNYTGAARR